MLGWVGSRRNGNGDENGNDEREGGFKYLSTEWNAAKQAVLELRLQLLHTIMHDSTSFGVCG